MEQTHQVKLESRSQRISLADSHTHLGRTLVNTTGIADQLIAGGHGSIGLQHHRTDTLGHVRVGKVVTGCSLSDMIIGGERLRCLLEQRQVERTAKELRRTQLDVHIGQRIAVSAIVGKQAVGSQHFAISGLVEEVTAGSRQSCYRQDGKHVIYQLS